MSNDDDNKHPDWSRDTRKIAALSWMSFLVASVFTMVCFAFLDPLHVVDAINIEWIESRNAGYAIGFFFLWANAWVAGWFTLRLVRRKRHGPTAEVRDP